MKNNILIIGCGSIGSRHLQSLASSSHELNIYVVDTETKSLQRAKKLYEEIDKKCINKVSFDMGHKNKELGDCWGGSNLHCRQSGGQKGRGQVFRPFISDTFVR